MAFRSIAHTPLVFSHCLLPGAQGPILAFVYAVKELLGEGAPGAAGPGGSLPCNVAFVVEGEEENGSAGFREVGNS